MKLVFHKVIRNACRELVFLCTPVQPYWLSCWDERILVLKYDIDFIQINI